MVLFGGLTLASAGTTNIYVEDWGSVAGGNTFAKVGWSYTMPAGSPQNGGGGPYEGIFAATGANDPGSGLSLPANTVYFEDMPVGFGMFYTGDWAGTGTGGDSAFTDIDPTQYTNLTFSMELNGSYATNYFAIQQGGTWYVSATKLASYSGAYLTFGNVSTPYTNLASAWNTLIWNSSGVSIGSTPSGNLSGLITAIGVVVSAEYSGFNYNQLVISAYVPPVVATPPPVVLYSEDWGAAYGSASGNTAATTLAQVGWNGIAIAYTGIYGATAGSMDVTTGVTVSNRAMYMSMSAPSSVGIVYTTDASGSGTPPQGDSAFSDIDPSLYPEGLTFNLDSQQSDAPVWPAGYVTNYLAVQVGGAWYVSATPFTNNSTVGGVVWSRNSLLYNSAAANWNTLTLGASSVTIGSPASAPLSGAITGIGIVEATSGAFANTGSGYGVNQVNLTITTPTVNPPGNVAPVIDAAGFSQTTFAGGAASFAVDAYVGTPTLTYTWTFAPAVGGAAVTIGNGANGSGTGSFIIGAATNVLTISNVSSADAGSYSVEVSNLYGQDYSTNYTTNTLTVNPLPNDVLYAETFPFVGPFATAEPLANIGWQATTARDIPNRLDESGAAYAYETAAKTTGFFASTNTDVAGLSGVPFPHTGINLSSHPIVSFRATMAAPANDANVTPYFAVQMAGGSWYVSTSPIQLAPAPSDRTNNTYGLQFDPAASGWNNLTVGSSSAIIGAGAAGNLTGNITGAGVVFVFTGAALYSIDSLMVVTDSTPPVLATFPSEPNVPYPQTVYWGSGVSFSFTQAGTLPFTDNWEFNDNGAINGSPNLTDGVTATGSIISGSQTTEITIQNVSHADEGSYDPTVTNPAGTTNAAAYSLGEAGLTVTSQPVGLIYNESFPVYALPSGNINLTNVGWTLQADTPNRVFKLNGTTADNQSGTSAAYAYEGGYTNAVLYASTTSDTGYSGLPFIAFDPANYPANSIQFSTSLAQGDASWTNVTVSFAVEQGGQWYAMAAPLITQSSTPAIALLAPASIGANYTPVGPQTYSPAASQWQTLTFVGTQGVLLGGTPAQNLSGPITAAGLLFQYFGAGGSINLNWFNIQAVGSTGANLIGGVNIGPVANGMVTLTWVGNPAVKLQSTTSLSAPNWQDVPNTLGMHSVKVSAAGTQQYFRLTGPAAP